MMTLRIAMTVSILLGAAFAFQRPDFGVSLFAQSRGDCKCPNVNAYSTPADEKDLCSKGETNGTCSLKWNLPTGGHRAAFDSAISRLKLQPQVIPPREFDQLCAGRPGNGPWCPWIEFLKRDDLYDQRPETTGVGFLAMASVAFAMGPQEERDRAILVLTEGTRASSLGQVVAKGGDWQARQSLYELRAALGCLAARALPNGRPIIIQNRSARLEGTCAQ